MNSYITSLREHGLVTRLNHKESLLEKMRRERGYLLPTHELLAADDPEFLGRYDSLFEYVMGRNGALPIRVKELIVIAILSMRGAHREVELHIGRALKHGATKTEIIEALETAMFYSGAPTLMHGIDTLIRQLSEKKG